MDKLPPEIARLVDEARAAHDPSPDQRARVGAAVGAAIAAGAASTAGGGAAAAAVGTKGAAGAAVAGTGAASAGVGAVSASKLVILAVATATAGGLYVSEPWQGQPGDVAAKPVPVAAPIQAPGAAAQAPSEDPTPSVPAGEPGEVGAGAAIDGDDGLAHEEAFEHALPDKPNALPGKAAVPRPARRAVGTKISATSPTPQPEGQAVQEVHEPTAVPEADTEQPLQTAKPVATTASALQQEMRLIREATRAVRDGQPYVALRQLNEHAEHFPKGALRQERLGLRALALCSAGDATQGAEAQRRFLKAAPDSPMAARVRAACAPVGPAED